MDFFNWFEYFSIYPEKLDDDDLWDGMKEDANSLRNTYNVDVTDVGVALTGISKYNFSFFKTKKQTIK